MISLDLRVYCAAVAECRTKMPSTSSWNGQRQLWICLQRFNIQCCKRFYIKLTHIRWYFVPPSSDVVQRSIPHGPPRRGTMDQCSILIRLGCGREGWRPRHPQVDSCFTSGFGGFPSFEPDPSGWAEAPWLFKELQPIWWPTQLLLLRPRSRG